MAARNGGRLEPQSDRGSTPLVGPDADYVIHGGNEDFPVADFTRAGNVGDSLDDRLYEFVGDQDGNEDFRLKVDRVLGPSIEFGVTLLAAEASHFEDRQPRNSPGRETVFYLIQLERSNYGVDAFHLIGNLPRYEPNSRPLDLGRATNLQCGCQAEVFDNRA